LRFHELKKATQKPSGLYYLVVFYLLANITEETSAARFWGRISSLDTGTEAFYEPQRHSKYLTLV
jgi:hypothetical protein